MSVLHQTEETPIILGIDTSGERCTVGVIKGTTMLFACEFFLPFLHDAALAEICQLAFRQLRLSVETLSAVAIIAGPGSFTGLRIGVSFVRALCLPFDHQYPVPRCITVSSLEALAAAAVAPAQALKKKAIIAIIPSHKNIVYAQKFTAEGIIMGGMECCAVDDLVSNADTSVLYCGRGLGEAHTMLGKEVLACEIKPELLLQLALHHFREGKFADPLTVVPHYGQEFTPRSEQ